MILAHYSCLGAPVTYITGLNLNGTVTETDYTNQLWYFNGSHVAAPVTIGSGISFTGGTLSATAGGGGTVTSFSAGTLSPLFTTSVATATTTPALTFILSNASANTVFAGPTSGSPAAPTFRALVSADIPFALTNPMTTLGDTIYGSAAGVPTRLAGNTAAHTQYWSQTGTGSVSAVPAWLDAPTFNVKDYGAVGDGSTSDQTAVAATFAAAIATNKKAAVYFPQGTYRLTAVLSYTIGSQTAGFTIFGDGMGSSVLIWDGTGGIKLTPVAPQQLGINNFCQATVRNLTLATKSSSGGGTAIWFNWSISDRAVPGPQVLDCNFPQYLVSNGPTVTGYWTNCVDFDTCINPIVRDSYMQGKQTSGTVGVKIGYSGVSTVTTVPTTLLVQGCYIISFDKCVDLGTGISQYGEQGPKIIGNQMIGNYCVYFDQSGGSDVGELCQMGDDYFDSDVEAVHFNHFARIFIHDCQFDESSNAIDIKIRNGEQNEIHNNFFDGGDLSSVGTAIDIDTTYSGNIDHNEFYNKTQDLTLGSTTGAHIVKDNLYTVSSGSTKILRAAVITDSADTATSNPMINIIGNPRSFNQSLTLTGGSPTETHFLNITDCNLAFKPVGASAVISINQNIAAQYDWDNVSNTSNSIAIRYFRYDGTNLGAVAVRSTILVNP